MALPMFYLFICVSMLMLVLFSIMDMKNGMMLEISVPSTFLADVPIIISMDFVSMMFFYSVSLISSVVFYYSIFYMEEDASKASLLNKRFFLLLFMFVGSMMILVFSGSWVMVMMGWDGLGLVSFLLVLFYNSSSSLNSSLLTMLMNRVGDCMYILSFIMFFFNGWFFLDGGLMEPALLFLFILFLGASTKSAQAPFSSWLPAAMAAPTPVSSLVHSSTLVTAGVFVLVRFNFLMEPIHKTVAMISLLTMLMAGSFALYEMDFKKVVAMSTLSQLGFMVYAISIGMWYISFFHMIFHAFFKSSLFLSTGNLMHYIKGGQDSRMFGSMGYSFFSKLFFTVSCLSLSGFPFSLGFYSKDLVVGLMSEEKVSLESIMFFLGCTMTIAYSLRLMKMGFSSFPAMNSSLELKDSLFFYAPMVILYMSCVFTGGLFYFFLPLTELSFLDCVLGLILLILSGLVLYSMPQVYSMLNKMLTMSFLTKLSAPVPVSSMTKIQFLSEYTWSEILGGGGMKMMFEYMIKSNKVAQSKGFMAILLVAGILIF